MLCFSSPSYLNTFSISIQNFLRRCEIMRLFGLAILCIFNTLVSIFVLFALYGLFRLNFGLIEGVTDNSGLFFFIFLGLILLAIVWFSFYQIYKYNRKVWLSIFLLIGIVLVVFNSKVFWFLFLMLIYFIGVGLIYFDKSFTDTKDRA